MLNDSEPNLFAKIVRRSKAAIILHDMRGVIQHWNMGASTLFGYEESDALGNNIHMCIESTNHALYDAYIQRLLNNVVDIDLEIQGITREGRQRDLSLNATVLQDKDSNPLIIATTIRDITEQNSNEQKLVALIESTPDPFIIVESSGLIQRVNRQAELLFGYSRQELIGQSFKMLVPERFRSEHDVFTRNYHLKPAMRQMGSGLELWCLPKSGDEIPVEIGLSPVVTRDETAIMVRFRDIRVQKDEQELLNQARQKADEANRTKTRFLAAASHDLRQPLQSISMNLGVLAGELHAKEKPRVIENIRMALDTSNKLLNSLLNITRLEAGKVQPEIETCQINEVLDRVYNTVSQQAKDKTQRFSLIGSSVAVTSDPALLEQLITNLVANAIRYTPSHGHILLGCRRQGMQIKVQVADNGPGIASHELDNIFDEYRQLETAAHYLGKGLGLGLSIVKLIAELLNLQLEVKSTPGKGSSFSVLVPLANDKPKLRHPKLAIPGKANKRQGTLLLIDDDVSVLESTSMFLELSGFKVVAVGSSAAALASLQRHTPDLIITDYGLAEQQTGVELLAMIRKVLRRNIPAIVVTGDLSVERANSVNKANYQVISKPIEAQTLLQLVQHQFDLL